MFCVKLIEPNLEKTIFRSYNMEACWGLVLNHLNCFDKNTKLQAKKYIVVDKIKAYQPPINILLMMKEAA